MRARLPQVARRRTPEHQRPLNALLGEHDEVVAGEAQRLSESVDGANTKLVDARTMKHRRVDFGFANQPG